MNSPTTPSAAGPRRGGTLTVALDSESTGLDPQRDHWGYAGHVVGDAIFDTLATLDADGLAQPDLAESITPNADSTVWTITVRDGIRFQDGEPLDAAAVKLNFDTALANPDASADLQLIRSVEVVDDRSVAVSMSAPWGTFANLLVGSVSQQFGYIAAPAMLKDPDGGRHPIGTGPFTFDEWTFDDHLTVVRNDDYWRGPVALDRVVFRPIVDNASAVTAFEAGDVDVMYSANVRSISSFVADDAAGEAHVVVGSPSDPDLIALNTTRPPLDDVRVRRALAMALDRGRLLDLTKGAGLQEAMKGPYSESSFWYVPTSSPAFDVEAARALIDDYERDVGPVEFEYRGTQDPAVLDLQQLVQSMWADIGAEADIVSAPQSENIDAVIAGDFEAIGWGGVGGGDPDRDYANFHSGSGLNITGFHTPQIDAAMETARALSDPNERAQQYSIVQRQLADAMPYLWLNSNTWAVVGHADVHGLDDATLPNGAAAQPLLGARFSLRSVWLDD